MRNSYTTGRVLLGILYICIATVIIVVIFLSASRNDDRIKSIILNGAEINVELADSPLLQEKGLSGHKELSSNEGMLFPFKFSGQHAFWMKDMTFPIDIIWFDSHRQIVDVWEKAEPSSYPYVRIPQTGATYVLEVPQGFYTEHHLKIGDTFEYKK